MTDATPRGIRNNNPGNVEWHPTSDPWRGIDAPPSDGRFCRFVAPQWGLRVIGKLLLAYQNYHGCNTVSKILKLWAPEIENDTAGYIFDVASRLGVGKDDVISVYDTNIMCGLIRAIVVHENGEQPYGDAMIRAGASAAYGE